VQQMSSQFQQILQPKSPAEARPVKDTIRRYLSYYPLFCICLFISMASAFIYLRYTVPLYRATTFINVKGETNLSKGNAGSSEADLINKAMNGGRAVINLDNELARLRSARLMEHVVRNNALNISYYKKGAVRVTDIYEEAPFRLIEQDIQDSAASVEMKILKPTDWGVTIKYGEKENSIVKAVAWNRPFDLNGNTYLLNPQSSKWNIADVYIVRWSPVYAAVYELLPKVTVDVIGKTSNIGLWVDIENASRGEVLLDRMVSEFIQMNLDDQNKAAQDKIYFIEERLNNVSGELKGVEKELSGFQGKKLLVGGQDANVTGVPIAEANKAIADINTQLRLLALIRNTLNEPASANKLLPSGLGFSDEVLSGLISQYNTLVLTRQREAPQVAGNSLVLKDLDNQIAVAKRSVVENLESISRGFRIQLANQQAQGSMFKASLSAVPEKTRVMGEISREKSVKENLYVYLLQKREEAAIAKTTSSPYEQVDAASSYGPVSPARKSVYLYAVALGLLLPAGIIFLRDALNDKISGKDEITAATGLSVVGEISYIKKEKDRVLPALAGGIVGEQFRGLRTNLSLLNKDVKNQVLLVTSSISGEGKSFVSQNLAVVMARAGKKVALLELDIRKPAESPLAQFHGKGLGDYLLGDAELEHIAQSIEGLPGLHIYPSGNVVTDAADLLVDGKVAALFAALQEQYDVLVINAAPVGLVSDALVLQQYATSVAYVVRQGFTPKSELAKLNTLISAGKLPRTQIVFNGLRAAKKYGYAYGNQRQNPYFNRAGLAAFK